MPLILTKQNPTLHLAIKRGYRRIPVRRDPTQSSAGGTPVDGQVTATKAYGLPKETIVVLIKENSPENVGVAGKLIIDRK